MLASSLPRMVIDQHSLQFNCLRGCNFRTCSRPSLVSDDVLGATLLAFYRQHLMKLLRTDLAILTRSDGNCSHEEVRVERIQLNGMICRSRVTVALPRQPHPLYGQTISVSPRTSKASSADFTSLRCLLSKLIVWPLGHWKTKR